MTAIYVRVSSAGQAGDDKVSLGEQLQACRHKARELGAGDVVEISDVGPRWSSDRPGFQRLLGMCRRGEVERIIAWKDDRIVGGLRPLVDLEDATEGRDVDLVGVVEPMDRRLLGIKAAIARLEVDNIRERTRMGFRGKARRGEFSGGGVPYGFHKDDRGRIEHYPEEASIAERILQEIVEGVPLARIAWRLNGQGVPTRGGGQGWTPEFLAQMARNPSYKGELVRGSKVEGYTPVRVSPIISEELWERVQQRLSLNRQTARRNTRCFYLLQHLLRCRECGKGFTVMTHRRKRKEYRYYRCWGQDLYPQRYPCRQPAVIRAEAIEGRVRAEVTAAFESPTALATALEEYRRRLGATVGELASKKKAASRELSRCDLEEQRVATLFRKGLLSERAVDLQLRVVKEEKGHWEAELQRLDEAAMAPAGDEDRVALAERVATRVKGKLASMTDEEFRDFLRLVVDRIWVDGHGNIEIHGILPRSDADAVVDCKSGSKEKSR